MFYVLKQVFVAWGQHANAPAWICCPIRDAPNSYIQLCRWQVHVIPSSFVSAQPQGACTVTSSPLPSKVACFWSPNGFWNHSWSEPLPWTNLLWVTPPGPIATNNSAYRVMSVHNHYIKVAIHEGITNPHDVRLFIPPCYAPTQIMVITRRQEVGQLLNDQHPLCGCIVRVKLIHESSSPSPHEIQWAWV